MLLLLPSVTFHNTELELLPPVCSSLSLVCRSSFLENLRSLLPSFSQFLHFNLDESACCRVQIRMTGYFHIMPRLLVDYSIIPLNPRLRSKGLKVIMINCCPRGIWTPLSREDIEVINSYLLPLLSFTGVDRPTKLFLLGRDNVFQYKRSFSITGIEDAARWNIPLDYGLIPYPAILLRKFLSSSRKEGTLTIHKPQRRDVIEE